MGRNNGCYLAAMGGAFALGVILTVCCSFKTALVIAVCFLIGISWLILRW